MFLETLNRKVNVSRLAANTKEKSQTAVKKRTQQESYILFS